MLVVNDDFFLLMKKKERVTQQFLKIFVALTKEKRGGYTLNVDLSFFLYSIYYKRIQ